MQRAILLLLSASILLSLVACSLKPAPDPGPTIPKAEEIQFEKASVKFSEADQPIGGPFGLNKSLDTVKINGITYAFEPEIPMAERTSCMQATQLLLNHLGTDGVSQVCVYTTKSYDRTFVRDGIIYTHVQDWQSADYTAAVLQVIFGEYCNYGLVSGYANYLRNQLYGAQINLCEADFSYNGEPDALDMNYLCFHAAFTAGKDTKAVRKLANTFVAEYIHDHGEAAFWTLLIQSGDPATVSVFTQELTDFYSARDITREPSQLLFRMGGKGYHYIVRTPYATFCVETAWVEANARLLPIYDEQFLHRDYSEVKDYFTTVSREMGQYQQLFGLDSYRNDLTVYFTNQYNSNRSAYLYNQHAIALPYINSVSLLYIDSLVRDKVLRDDWAYNGIRAYYSYYYDQYGNAETTYSANMDSEASGLQVYRDFRAWLGRDVDIEQDFTDLTHFYAWSKKIKDPNNGASDSFIAYLISRFGEKAVLDLLLQRQNTDWFHYEELVADWQIFLAEKFAQ